MKIDLDKNWWIVNVAAGIVGIIVLVVAGAISDDLELYAMSFLLLVVGLSFLWVFMTRAEEAPWAIAPAVGCFTFLLIGLVNQWAGLETFGWQGSLILGAGAVLTAAIPNPRAEIKLSYIVALWFLVPGFLLTPWPLGVRIILAAVSVLGVAFVLWRNREVFRPST